MYTLGAQRRCRARAGRPGRRRGRAGPRSTGAATSPTTARASWSATPSSPWAPDHTTAGRTCTGSSRWSSTRWPTSACRRGTWDGFAGYPGVWVGLDEHRRRIAGPRKIAAIGVRTARGRTTHGFALNVTTDLADVRPHRAVRDRRPTGHLAGRRGTDLWAVRGVEAVVVAAEAVWGPVEDVQLVTAGPSSGPDVGRRADGPVGPAARTGDVGGPAPVPVALGRRADASPAPASTGPGRGRPRRRRGPATSASRRGSGSRSRMGERLPRPQADHARPRPRHGVRGGRLPQHLRVLGRRHRHLHDQRRRAAPGPAASAWSTPASRCPLDPGEPDRVAEAGRAAWAWPTPWSPAWPATTWPMAAPVAFAATIAAIRRRSARHDRRGADLGLQG